MFYLELADGDKFFTDKNSEDVREFDKIIHEKLGRDASDLFELLVHDSEDKAAYVLHNVAVRYKDCVNRLDAALNDKEVDKVKLEEILSDLQAIYTDYLL